MNTKLIKQIVIATILPIFLIIPSTSSAQTITKSCNANKVCKTYFEVWKLEQRYQNNISSLYLKNHFKPESINIDKWNEGESFRIIYDIYIGWAQARTSDVFIVKTLPSDNTYPAIKIRRGKYLSTSEIRKVVNESAWNGQFTWFTPKTKLFFKTKQDAIDAINKVDPTRNFEISDEISFDKVNIMEKTKEVLEREKQISDILKSQNLQVVGGGSGPNFPNPKAKREMFLTGYDMSKCESLNEMIVVRLNLFTGKTESQTTPCAISMN